MSSPKQALVSPRKNRPPRRWNCCSPGTTRKSEETPVLILIDNTVKYTLDRATVRAAYGRRNASANAGTRPEHDVLFAAIRKNQPVNDGKRLADSTLPTIMGRIAAYTGQQVTSEQAFNSQGKLVPEHLDWNGSLEVKPHAEPGKTKLL